MSSPESQNTMRFHFTVESFTDSLSSSTPTFSESGAAAVPEMPDSSTPVAFILVVFYVIICAGGLLGNGLVIFVVSRYSSMKTVVNHFILNLSVADGVFILGLPLVIATSLARHWIFGPALCKAHYAATCVNMFTGSFTLTVMSADRFAAVYFPLASRRYRTPRNAVCVVAVTWALSLVAMTPVVVYANSVAVGGTGGGGGGEGGGRRSCTIEWPVDSMAVATRIYIVYTFLLGFVVPAAVISLLYTLVVLKLRSTAIRQRNWRREGGGRGGGGGRPRRRNVTRLVSLIVVVYAVCWSPYWSFQVYLISGPRRSLRYSEVLLFQIFTVLSYANSAVNPLLYAFTNDRFRASFASAFRCRRGVDGSAHATAMVVAAGDATVDGAERRRRSSGRGVLLPRRSREEIELQIRPEGNPVTGNRELDVGS